MTCENIHRHRCIRNLPQCVSMALTAFMVAVMMCGHALAVDISNSPLETQVKTAPSNLMFVLDDSSSMDAEFMTSQADGLFSERSYLFGDDAYLPASDHTLGAGNALMPAQRLMWRSQWAGHNKVFYDPSRFYRPWPATADRRFGPADIDMPLSNPLNTAEDSSRLILADPFFNVPAGTQTVMVLNAHYFTVIDTDGDGAVDPGERVYLVAWADTDGDGQLDLGGAAGGDLRRFYRFADDGDDRVEAGELVLVMDEAEKDLVRPRVSGEADDARRFRTDREDLQNFANWASYHRRRQLAAKSVVARAVAGLKNVFAGLYAVNDAPRLAVQPVKPEDGGVIVVDNEDAGFSTSGTWQPSDTAPAYGASALFTRQAGAAAVFRPDLPVTARYRVSAWWPCAAGRDRSARYEIGFAGGTQTAVVEKDQSDGGASQCGDWVMLGTWDFTAGTDNAVRLVRGADAANGTSTAADALRFENLSQSGAQNGDRTDFLLNELYGLDADGPTPLRQALDQVGRYFDQATPSILGASPFADEDAGGGCQRAYAIVITDGFWNGEFSGVGNADGDKGSPFADSASETLADIAMHYYETDLAPGLPDLVTRKGCDDARRQHMTTYTLSFGVNGTIDIDDIDNDGQPDSPGYVDDPCFTNPQTPRPDWPAPAAGEATTIDDLWHAAVNGRGLYFRADNPQGLMASLGGILADIAEPASAANIAVSSDLVTSESTAFQASYQSGDWSGDLRAFEFDLSSGAVENAEGREIWSAARRLGPPGDVFDSRRIATYGGLLQPSRGVAFRYDNLSDDQRAALGSDSRRGSSADLEARNVLQFIRGRDVADFRQRDSLLGDIVHSSPVLVGDTVFVGANDGMLHAFDALTGDERFAYVPNLVFDHLKALSATDYNQNHRFFVDATPFAGEVEMDLFTRHNYLVGGLGKGGKGYFALLAGIQTRTRIGADLGPFEESFSVDSIGSGTPESAITSIVQWEYPRPDQADDGMDNDGDGQLDEPGEFDPDMGFSFGQGYAVNANAPPDGFRPTVIFANGYNSFSGRAVLYILEADTGELIRKIDTGVGGDNGLSVPAVIDADLDRRVDYVFAGDLKGNVWKFDLTAQDPALWGVAYGEDVDGDGRIDAADGDVPRPLFQAIDQPITGRPDVMFASSACAVQAPGFLVIVGTGRFLGESDIFDDRLQSIYGLWDFGDDSDDSEFLGTVVDRDTGALSTGFSLVRQEIIVSTGPDGQSQRELTNTTIDFSSVDDSLDGDNSNANNDDDIREANPLMTAGWFIDFPRPDDSGIEAGERVTGNVVIRGGSAVVVSFAPSNAPCTGGGTSRIYVVNGCLNNNEPRGPGSLANIIRIDGRIGGNPLILKLDARRQTDRVLVSDSSGRISTLEILGETWGKVFWRQNVQP